jgi:CubicO group peptidase (beta-lactamase class C family)
MLRTLLLLSALLLSSLVWGDEPYFPTQQWRTSTPEEQGIASEKLAEALLTMQQNNLDIHSFMILRNGYVVVDAYFYPYDGTTVHELASVSKSIMTTLIGIAVDQSKLSLDDTMLSFFPEYTLANRDALKERITVQHLASMSSGLECTAQNDEQTLQEMRESQDWVKFTLDRKVMFEPGTHFEYCSPAIHLLSPILEKATGMTALEFAQKYLFEPLDIKDALWLTDPQGHNRGSEGVYLHPHDMARLGYLWLNKGVWEGKQIVSKEWVESSTTVQMETGGSDNYGYSWWIATDEPAAYNAIGRGGQRIIVIPQWNLMVVTTGGGFDLDEIEPLVRGLLVDIEQTLPANAKGVEKLNAAISAVMQAPTPRAVAPLSETAKAISGKTFIFETNPLGMESAGFVFSDAAEATFTLKLSGSELVSWPVALNGVYRFFPGEHDLPMGLRGTWLDDKTFLLEYDSIANNDHTLLQLHFEGERVVVEARETAHELGTTVEGKLQSQ